MVTFGILGPVEVRDDEQAVPLGGHQQVALLAVLLVHANRAVASDALIDALWGDVHAAGATKRLQMAIARLRKALGGNHVLRTVSGGYSLLVGPGPVRRRRVRGAVAEGPGRAGDRRCGASGGRAAVGTRPAAWSGADGRRVPEFAQPEIRRLEELRIAALESRIDAELQLGLHAGLIGELQALVARYPTHERLAGQHMLALYRAGRQSDAIAAFRDRGDKRSYNGWRDVSPFNSPGWRRISKNCTRPPRRSGGAVTPTRRYVTERARPARAY